MKHLKKIFNAISKIVLVILVLGLLLMYSNRFIFVNSTPDKYVNSKWTGTWQSERLASIKGNLIINMPDTFPVNKELKVDALIYYDIWSLYKTGSIKEIKLTCFFDNNNSTGGENKINTQNNLHDC